MLDCNCIILWPAMKIVLGTVIFAFIAVGTVIIAIPHIILDSNMSILYESGIIRFFGIFPFTIGLILWTWSAWDFVVHGRRTPAPLYPPKQLVSRGLYQIVRNPMYLAVVSILLGEAIYFESFAMFIYVVVIWLLFHLFVVCYEEPKNRKTFGKAYEDCYAKVSRWVPKIR